MGGGMITDHDRLLAKEVISQAHKLYVAGEGDDLPECRELVLQSRWACRGTGGVAMSQRQTVAKVRAAINEFYAPDDYVRERNAG
jgi:hypothetical protein